jgi:hypothetical protein
MRRTCDTVFYTINRRQDWALALSIEDEFARVRPSLAPVGLTACAAECVLEFA